MMFNQGDKVRLTRAARKRMFWARLQYGNGTVGGFSMRKHLQEFRRCIGIVIGPMDWNKVLITDPSWDPSKVGPEINVSWCPSNHTYLYDSNDLEKV
jgi:hypothetical protein